MAGAHILHTHVHTSCGDLPDRPGENHTTFHTPLQMQCTLGTVGAFQLQGPMPDGQGQRGLGHRCRVNLSDWGIYPHFH